MIQELTPGQFVARRDAGEDLVLLDVREAHELQIASVPGIVHIPMGQIPVRFHELDRHREIVVLCRSGGRSMQVARFLAQQGFPRVANLAGGILRWREELDPSLQAY